MKKIKRFLVFFLLIIFFWNLYVFALDSKQKWIVLRNFKKQEKRLLFETDKPFLDKKAKALFDASRKYEIYKNIRESIQNKRELLEEENIKINNKIINIKASIKTVTKELDNLWEEIKKINFQILAIEKNINLKKKAIEILENKIKTNKEILYKYIVYLYKKGNFVYNDWQIDNLKAILYSNEDIGSIINDLNFNSIIQVTGKRLIAQHKKYINNLYVEQISLKKSRAESKKLRKQLIIKKALIKQKKEFKEKLLKISKNKQKIYKAFIADKKEKEDKVRKKEFLAKIAFIKNKRSFLKKQGCHFIDFSQINPDNLNISDKCKNLNYIIYVESKLKWFETDKAWNILSWPVEPNNWIATFFHDAWYIAMFWEDHEAIDIVEPQWTDIKAPADWYVIYLNKPTKTWYAFVALKHSNWIVTVYGHLSKIMVKQMQFVKKWEVFAKTWWTPWTAWAGPMTTWPHLHFEVWENQKLKDPLNFLNIAYLKPSSLPSIYFNKYKKDYFAKFGKEFKWKLRSDRKSRTFKITWKNEIERQKNLLKNYAYWDFKDWSTWVEEWLNAKIDPTFLMCVWLAETWLWKHLKTPYNVWNVWNTDSWETKYFKSAAEWIRAMTHTLNNKYLKKYNEIRMLSRYWNQDKAIYASSDFNWHNNVVTCMSFVKWRYVSDSYNFRLK